MLGRLGKVCHVGYQWCWAPVAISMYAGYRSVAGMSCWVPGMYFALEYVALSIIYSTVDVVYGPVFSEPQWEGAGHACEIFQAAIFCCLFRPTSFFLLPRRTPSRPTLPATWSQQDSFSTCPGADLPSRRTSWALPLTTSSTRSPSPRPPSCTCATLWAARKSRG